MKNITVGQVKAARALLGWDQVKLSEEAGIGVATVRRTEAAGGEVPDNTSGAKVVAALEKAGIIFMADGETTSGGHGVRLKA